MTKEECLLWLKILKVNQQNFPEISANKKIKALETAIKIIEQTKGN